MRSDQYTKPHPPTASPNPLLPVRRFNPALHRASVQHAPPAQGSFTPLGRLPYARHPFRAAYARKRMLETQPRVFYPSCPNPFPLWLCRTLLPDTMLGRWVRLFQSPSHRGVRPDPAPNNRSNLSNIAPGPRYPVARPPSTAPSRYLQTPLSPISKRAPLAVTFDPGAQHSVSSDSP